MVANPGIAADGWVPVCNAVVQQAGTRARCTFWVEQARALADIAKGDFLLYQILTTKNHSWELSRDTTVWKRCSKHGDLVAEACLFNGDQLRDPITCGAAHRETQRLCVCRLPQQDAMDESPATTAPPEEARIRSSSAAAPPTRSPGNASSRLKVAIPTNTMATTAPPMPVLRTNRSVAFDAPAATLAENRTKVEKLHRRKEEVLQSQIDEVASSLPRKGKLSLQLASRAAQGALPNASTGVSSTAKVKAPATAPTAPSSFEAAANTTAAAEPTAPANTTAAAEPKASRPSAAPANTTATEPKASQPSAG
eukprot:s43_g17.t1